MAATKFLEAHNNYLNPPENFLSEEHEQTLLRAKETYRAAFVNMATDRSDAKREVAYGVISTDQISELFKLARKIAWPLLGVGTVGGIIKEILRDGSVGSSSSQDNVTIGKDDVMKAINVLHRPCSELNSLCREGLEHVMCSLGMGKYAKPSPLARLFSKKASTRPDHERAQDLGTDAFLSRFDSGLEKFVKQRTNNLAQFFDEKRRTPTQGLFLVLFVEFLLYAVTNEIRGLIVFVDNMRNDGSLTRKRFIIPKMKVIQKAFTKVFHSRRPEDVSAEGYGVEESDVYTNSYTVRTNRTRKSTL